MKLQPLVLTMDLKVDLAAPQVSMKVSILLRDFEYRYTGMP